MSAEYQVHGSVAVITLNNPPVNGLGHATRSAAVQGMQQALADDAVKAIVITGAGKAFSGGADIKEFNSPKALAEPSLHSLIRTVEESTKPVVAAIHTVCMGGGLELALGCNYRVAMPGAQIALPEVKLGLLPGAGGTQRLPRVLGLEMALNMIVSGTPVASEKLAKTAIFDEVFAADANLLESAIAFAGKVAAARPLPKVRDRKVDYPNHEAFLQFSRNTVKAMSGPFPAPLECVECVAASVTKKFEDGLKFERERFLALIQTTESKSLRHAFFSERQASKVPDVPADTPTRTIKKAAVIGAGTMGGGIAMNFANAGIPVTILEMKAEALEKGLATIRKNYENTLKKGKLTQEKFDQRVALISGTMNSLRRRGVASCSVLVPPEPETPEQAAARRQQALQRLQHLFRHSADTEATGELLRPGLIMPTMEDVARRVQDLPSLPAVVGELLACVGQEGLDMQVLAGKLALDQSLSAKTLRLANSSFYGMPSRVTTIQQAVAVLGVHNVRTLVTACSITGSFRPKADGSSYATQITYVTDRP
eukprot:gene39388-48677_t